MDTHRDTNKPSAQMIPARAAAKIIDCAPDYVGKLCREGKLKGEMVENVWYVDRESIGGYLKSRDALKASRSLKLASERRAQIREHKYATSGLLGRFLLRVDEHRGFALGSIAVGLALVVTSAAVANTIAGRGWFPSSQSAALARVESPFFAGDMPTVSIGEIATGVSKFFASLFAPKQTTQFAIQNAPVASNATTTVVSQPVAIVPKPATVVTNTYPVIERTVERIVTNTVSGVSQDAFDQALNALRSQIAGISSGSSGAVIPYAPATRIDKLSGVAITGGTITSATISGGSISGVSINTGDLSGIVSITNGGTGTSSAPTYGKVLLGNASGAYDLVATSSLGITSGSGTFVGLTDTPSSIAAGDIFYGNGSNALVALPAGSNGQVLKLSGGLPTWGSDLQGAGGAGAWATTTDNLAVYPADTAQVVLVGNNATTTTGNIFEVTGNSLFRNQLTAYRTITAPTFTATSTLAASTFPYASSTALTVSGIGYFGTASTTNVTISSIASGSLLKTTTGGAVIAAVAGTDFENALTFTYPLVRSTNTITLAFGTTTSNTWGGTQTFTNTPVLGTLSGLVGSNNGALYQIATSTNFVTSLAAGAGISLSGTAGAVTVTNSIGYPFPSNATTTQIAFNGGATFAGATTTALAVTGSTTIQTLNLTNALTVANGGTGSTTLTGLLVGNGTGALQTATISSPLALSGTTLSITQATVAQNGYLSSTDFNTFNNKISSTSLSAGAGISYDSSTGVIANLIGYPFPNNATTTTLTFSGGLLTGTTTIGTLNATSSVKFTNYTSGALATDVLGNLYTFATSTWTFASSTLLADSNTWGGTQTFTNTPVLGTLSGLVGSNNGALYQIATSTNFVTSLAAGAGISLSGTAGAVTVTNSIGYPFVGNATTTTLTFSGGILTPTTTIGVLNATSSATLASTTLTGSSLFANATTTSFAISNISSGNLLKTTTGGAITAAVAGTDYTTPTGVATSIAAAYPFPNNATTTSIAFNGGLTATGATLSSTTLTGNFVFDTATGTSATTTNFFSTSARFTTASTTNLVISGLGSGSTQCLQINGSGTVSGTGSACGAGGGSFSYPFPNNATTTELAFNGGATFAGATTTALAVTGSTTISSTLNSTFANILGSTTLNGNTLLGSATSTNFAATNLSIASLSGILKATSGIVSTAVAGTDYTTPSGVASSIAAAFPFTATTNFGAAANSTSTPIWFANGLQASSTSQFAYASTTALTVNGSFYGASLSACDANTQKLLWSNGTFTCATDQNTGGGGGSFPFSADNNYGQVVYSTSTPTLWFKSGIFASSTSHFVSADFTSATTTNLAVTGVTSSLLKTLSSGAVVAAVAGTDYTDFGYLFPNNATSTLLNLTGGATTTQLTIYNRAYFGGTATTTIDSTGAITVTSGSTNTFPYASSTALSVSGSLYTPVTSAILKTDSTGKLTAAVAGTDYNTYAWPFTPTTNFGAAAVSTSTPVWFTAGIQASSTSHFAGADFSSVITSTATGANTFPYASSTALTVSGSFYGANLSTCNTGADKLLWNNGTFTCGTDAGASGTTEINWAYFNNSGIRVATSSNQVLIGGTSTSTLSRLEVVGGASFDAATSSALSVSGIASLAGTVGIGSTTPAAKLTVAGGNVLQVASGNPTVAATVATSSTTHSLASVVSGRYLYSADYEAGLRIIDISFPKSPASVGSYNTSMTHARAIAVAGKYAYVADDSAGLVILDVSRANAPTLVGTYAGINAYGIALSGRYAYITDNSNAVVRVVDVSDPTSPRLASSFQPNALSQPYSIAVQGKYAYVGDYGTSRIYVIDISNPAAPSTMGSYVGNSPTSLYVSGKYLYVADNGGGFYVLNVSNPASPALVGTYNGTAQYYGVQVAGDYAYVADNAGNAVVVDVHDPSAPALVGSVALGDAGRGITVSGKYGYVSAYGNSTKVIDLNGAQLPLASIGNIESNTANISDNLTVGGDASFGGGLDVGISGIFSRGTIAAYVASSTQTNPTVASFIGGNVGIGTTSPYAALSVAGQSVFNYITATGTTASSFAGGVNLNGGATTTSFAVTASSTVAGQFNSIFANLLASTTLSGNTLLINATTTNFFATLASTTNLFANGATTTALAITNVASGNLLKTTTGGAIIAAVAGTDYVTGAGLTSAYPFALTGNATSSLTQFNGGLTAYASSTIGNGTETGGLTISGGATTTGTLTLGGVINFIGGQSTTSLLNISGQTYFAASTTNRSIYLGLDAGTTSLRSGATAFDNFGVGNLALAANTTGDYNNALGYQALGTNASGSFNNALGYRALYANITGSNNNAFGNSALLANTTGWYNNAIGTQALTSNTTGSDNTAIGYQALISNTTGSYNSAIGQGALASNTTGSNNNAIGYQAGYNISTGYSNTLIGDNTQTTGGITAGGGNIGLGSNVFFPSVTANRQLNIGNLLFGSLPATSTSFAEATNGTLGVATSSPFAKFAIHANNGSTNTTLFAIGSSTASATTTLFSVSNTGLISGLNLNLTGGATTTALAVTGSTTISSVLNVGGAVSANSTLSVAGNVTISNSGGLIVGGATRVTAAGAFLAGDGSAGAPSHSFSNSTTNGMFLATTDTLGFSTAGTQRLTIDASGNVGIGTTSPYRQLSVGNSAVFGGDVLAGSFTATSSASLASTTLTGNTLFSNATSSGSLAVTGSTTISGVLNALNTVNLGASTLGSLTVAGNTTLANATSTSFFANVLTANVAAFGQTATSSFSSAGVLNIANQGQSTSTIVTLGGVQFLSASSSATGNLFLGLQAGQAITSGNGNTGVGNQVLSNNTTGFFNTANGHSVLAANTTGTQNTATGYRALNINTTGSYNTADGVYALLNNTTGVGNVANGYSALQNNTSSYNTALGYQAGSSITTGYGNVLIGASEIATNLTTGGGSIGIGANIFFASTTANSQLNIGNFLFGTVPATSTAFRLPTSGSLGVGTSSPFAKFSIQSNNGDTATTLFAIGSSTASATSTLFSISNTGSTTLFQIPSSILKTDANGTIIAAVAGTDYVTGAGLTAAFPFTATTFGSTAANSTSTLIGFTNGIYALASSTIGAGGQTTGLTISGGATTTGNLAVSGSATIVGTASAATVIFSSTIAGSVPLIRATGGTASAPTYGFNSDGNTGIFTPGADLIGFSTGGTERLRISSTGAVGVGTTSPFAKLSVHTNNGDTNEVLFAIGSSTASATSTLFSVSNTGLITGLNFSLSNGTTSALAVTGSSTITGALNSVASNLLGSTTLLGNSLFTNATTTSFAISGISSDSILKTTTGGAIIAAVAGTDFVTGAGLTAAFPFTATTNFGATANSTSTAIWFQNGLQASSTTRLSDISTIGILDFATTSANATSTLVSFNGQTFLTASSTGFNTGLGLDALARNTLGSKNTAVGYQALLANTTATDNSAFGYKALTAATTGSSNIAVGSFALNANTSGSSNVAIGVNAAGFNSSGSQNIALGTQAGYTNTTGSGNISIGYRTGGYNAATGVLIGNISIGDQAGLNINPNNPYNTLIGYQAGSAITTGYANILLGASVNTSNLTTGDGSIGIGNNIFFASSTNNNQLNIGNILFGTLPATSTAFAEATTGALGVATSSPFAKFAIHANASSTATTLFAIGSTTLTGSTFSTTTVFSIANNGSTALAVTGAATNGIAVTVPNTYSGTGISVSNASNGTVSGTLASFGVPTGSLTGTGVSIPISIITSGTGLNISGGLSGNGSALTGKIINVDYTRGQQSGSDTVSGNFLNIKRDYSATGGTLNVTGDLVKLVSLCAIRGGACNDSSTILGLYQHATSSTGTIFTLQSAGAGALAALTATSTSNGVSVQIASTSASSYLLDLIANNGVADAFRVTGTQAVGVASSSPFARFAIHTNPTDVATPTTLFAIGSSTASATSTLFSISNTGSTTLFQIPSSILKTDANGTIIAAVAGTDYVTGAGLTAAFPFTATTFGSTAANSTSTLIGFTNGIYALASSTIGAGGQTTGLTISGGATTTGNAYFGGTLTIPVGSVSAPSIALSDSSNTGIYSPLTGTIGITAGGAQAFYTTSSLWNQGVDFRSGTTRSFYLKVGAGTTPTAAAPAYSFSGDQDAGIFSAAADTIGFSTNGTEKLRITSTGLVGIGTTSPFSLASIHANNGDTNTTLFAIGSSTASATTTLFSVDNTGSTTIANGINVTSGCFAIGGTCLQAASFTYPFPSNATSTLLTFSGGLLSTASTTIGAGGQATGLTISGGATTTGSFVVTGAYASTTKFYANGLTTCQGGSVLTYDGAGTFGCATDQTAAGGWPFTPTTAFGTAANATSTLIGFTNGIYALASSTIGNGTQTGGLTISGGATTTATSTLAGLLVTSGNVGIGTLTPTYKLDISGTLRATSAVTFDSTLSVGSTLTLLSGGAGSATLSVNPSGRLTYNSSDTINGAHIFSFGGTAAAQLEANGNFGLGTTSPYAKLSVFAGGDYTALAASTLFAVGSTTAGTATTTLFSILSSGNIGIGTSSPGSRLSLTQAASVSQFTLAYDSSNATFMRTDSTGDLWIVPSGNDARMTNGNLWVCSGGSITSNACPSGTPSGSGNLIVHNTAGIGTSTPSAALTVYSTSATAAIFGDNTGAVGLGQDTQGTDATIQGYTTTSGIAAANLNLQPNGGLLGVATSSPWGLFSINPTVSNGTAPSFVIGSSTATRFIVTNAGNVGIGTTTPSQQLSVGGKLFVGANGATGMGTATSTFQGDVLITGKLDVSTIDPVYTIDGVKYATYGLSSVGIKEEMSTTITLGTKNEQGKYEHDINFSEVEKGSDLWLFYQVTTFGDGWKDLVANLTPGFDGTVHYVKDPATNTLRIIGDAPGEVSVRLVSARFDADSWPNLRPDQNGGFGGFQLQSKQ